MTGVILNALGIILGGILGMVRPTPLSAQTQAFFRSMLGAAAIIFGLRLTWLSVGGSIGVTFKQIFIALLALILGRLLGKLLHIQKASNHLGRYARGVIESHRPSDPHRFSNGMNVCAVLFCAAPLGILGAVHSSLPTDNGGMGHWQMLAVKALMDALAMMGFAAMFGVGELLSALPVFVFQGTITLACGLSIEPILRTHQLLDSVNATGGLLVTMISVVIFEIRRVELADYLPALAVAPLITWVWR